MNLIGNQVSAKFQNDEPVRDKLLLTLWTMANRETFRQTANRYGYRNKCINNIEVKV